MNIGLNDPSKVSIPNWDPTPESYPYTGRGFTGSKEVVLPEYYHTPRQFEDGDILDIKDATTGEKQMSFIFDGDIMEWIPRK
ncbi:hypothetical protein RCO48_02950 [Peribacillus frigoritolerans]|nr:hypothetical protein [Peribacillus frigoritolerans]